MKTLSKRLKRQQAKCNELIKENEKLKRDIELYKHLVQQQLITEQNARKAAENLKAVLEETQKYLVYMTKKTLEKNEEMIIEMKDIHNINQEEITIEIYEGNDGKIEKLKMKLREEA